MQVSRMSREQVAAMFPRASRSTLEANSLTTTHRDIITDVTGHEFPTKKPRQNKTELAFGLILESQKNRGEIVDYRFEGVTIRLADDCRYTPDFFIIVSLDPLKIRFAETKGKHIWDDSKIKWRVAKEQNSWAEWELWQKKGAEWNRLL